MKQYTCIIIDDEELSRDLLENFIGRLSHLRLIAKYSNPLHALHKFSQTSVDLVFLDIQMPEMSGIEFLKALSNAPAVIFTTAYDRYAIDGFELSVLDYLLKPFSFARFLKAINKATELIELRRNEKKEIHQDGFTDASSPLKYLFVKADHKLHRVHLKDLLYIQSMKEYVVYFTNQGKVMALGSLKSLEDKLPSADFMRIHKSYIVAKHRVESIEGNQLHVGNTKLPIGGSYRSVVKATLFNQTED